MLVAAMNGYLSIAGSWTRVSRVRAEYPNQLDYNGCQVTVLQDILYNLRLGNHWLPFHCRELNPGHSVEGQVS